MNVETVCRQREIKIIVLWNVPVRGHCGPSDVVTGLEHDIPKLVIKLVVEYQQRGCSWRGEPVKALASAA